MHLNIVNHSMRELHCEGEGFKGKASCSRNVDCLAAVSWKLVNVGIYCSWLKAVLKMLIKMSLLRELQPELFLNGINNTLVFHMKSESKGREYEWGFSLQKKGGGMSLSTTTSTKNQSKICLLTSKIKKSFTILHSCEHLSSVPSIIVEPRPDQVTADKCDFILMQGMIKPFP